MPSQRRTFLSTAASLSIAGIAGCSAATDSLGDAAGGVGSQGLEDQKAVVDRFITGVNENDIDAVNESVRGWAAGGFTEENIDEYTFERGDLRRTNSEDGDATLKADLTITRDGDSRTERASFYLVEVTDEWWISELLVVGGFVIGDTVLAPPMVSIDSSYDRDATSSDSTGVLTLTHRSEAPIPTHRMSVNGTITDPDGADPDVTTVGASVREATGRSRFTSGETLTIGVEHEYQVSLLFTKAGIDEMVFLGEFEQS